MKKQFNRYISIKNIFFTIIIFLGLCFSTRYVYFLHKTHCIETLWGCEKIDHTIIAELIESHAMQRIKHIDQGGPCAYFGMSPYFRRYDHCIGVWALVKHFGASINEQCAALLHDTSHTIFSHIADKLFTVKNDEHSYQDGIHLWFLDVIGIQKITTKHGISLEQLNPDLPEYKMLECSLPDMCADRIEYNIHTALLYGLISQKDVKKFISHLHYENNVWFYDCVETAKKFALISLHFTKTLWGSESNATLYYIFTELLKRAVEINLISLDDIHFGTDQEILNKLQQSKDNEIKILLKKCKSIEKNFDIVSCNDDYTFYSTPKFRGINPFVMVNEQLKRLTELDCEYNEEYNTTKEWCKKGYYIKIKK
jgi:HD superfamily phosphohydrolase